MSGWRVNSLLFMREALLNINTMSLGRGLNSLIPDKKSVAAILNPTMSIAEKDGRLMDVRISQVDPNPYQPRRHFGEKELQELTDSIKEHGVIQPIVVTPAAAGRYYLVVGERRLRAAKAAGFSTIPAVVRTTEDQQKLEMALIENIQRQDLNPIEEALAYKQLRDEFGLKQFEIAKRTGKTEPVITCMLAVLELPQEMQDAVAGGTLGYTSARAIALALRKNPEEALKLWKESVEKKWTRPELERTAARRNPKPRTTLDPVLVEKEKELEGVLGTKVRVSFRNGRGSIHIDFFSDEEFRNAIERLLKC